MHCTCVCVCVCVCVRVTIMGLLTRSGREGITLRWGILPITLSNTVANTSIAHYAIIYRIAGKFDGDLNLANWRFWTATAKVYSRQIYDLRTVILPSAIAIAKFKTAKYLGKSKPPNILPVKFSGYTVHHNYAANPAYQNTP